MIDHPQGLSCSQAIGACLRPGQPSAPPQRASWGPAPPSLTLSHLRSSQTRVLTPQVRVRDFGAPLPLGEGSRQPLGTGPGTPAAWKWLGWERAGRQRRS